MRLDSEVSLPRAASVLVSNEPDWGILRLTQAPMEMTNITVGRQRLEERLWSCLNFLSQSIPLWLQYVSVIDSAAAEINKTHWPVTKFRCQAYESIAERLGCSFCKLPGWSGGKKIPSSFLVPLLNLETRGTLSVRDHHFCTLCDLRCLVIIAAHDWTSGRWIDTLISYSMYCTVSSRRGAGLAGATY